MTYDNRYPWMTPVDGRPLPGMSSTDAARVRRWAGQIQSRTGLKPFYNSNFKNVLFALGDEPFGGPITVPVYQGNAVREVQPQEIDDACSAIGLARLSRAEKDRIAARNAQLAQWERDEKSNKHCDERRPGALDYARYRDQKRRGVGKVIAT